MIFDPTKTRIHLFEAGERILPIYAAELSAKAAAGLNRLGVSVHEKAIVSEITPEAVTIKCGESVECIACRTVIWVAGVQASPLGQVLADRIGAKTDRAGQLLVEQDLTIAGHPELFVIGDLANYSQQTGQPLAGVAPVAIQEGRYVARVITARIEKKPMAPFHYRDRGSMAIIGRASAVAEIGRLRFSGYFAWLAWLFVHLVELVEFQNKILVLVQWGWYYFSRNRAARLITRTAAPDVTADVGCEDGKMKGTGANVRC
jgi:NADH dehydrogenase